MVAVLNTRNTLDCTRLHTFSYQIYPRCIKMSVIHRPVYAVVIVSVMFSFIPSEFVCVMHAFTTVVN